jgi:DNA-binding CsgD family transcriptional regulator
MNHKPTTNYPPGQMHRLPAGLIPGDKSTELFGCRETFTVWAMSDGKTIPFAQVDAQLKAMIMTRLIDDDVAYNSLFHLGADAALEHYAFCVYGSADHDADFDAAGNLGRTDNFICGRPNCNCMDWESKAIMVDGMALTPRQIQIIQAMAGDKPNKAIAAELNIAESTLDTHMRNIYALFNVNSKTGMVTKAIQQKIIQ